MKPLRAQQVQQLVGAVSGREREPRQDNGQRDAVAHGIATLAETGAVPAVEYLKSQGVRGAVIERVLLEPQRRRT